MQIAPMTLSCFKISITRWLTLYNAVKVLPKPVGVMAISQISTKISPYAIVRLQSPQNHHCRQRVGTKINPRSTLKHAITSEKFIFLFLPVGRGSRSRFRPQPSLLDSPSAPRIPAKSTPAWSEPEKNSLCFALIQ